MNRRHEGTQEEGQRRPGMTELGIILVSDNGITVQRQQRDGPGGSSGITETAYTEATIENLQDATRILAAWMDLKFEDMASECRRIHNNDQFDAFIREAIPEMGGGRDEPD